MQICLQAARHGFNAKLTGAGGGGCVLVYIPDILTDDEEQQRAAMMVQLADFAPVETDLGALGVTVTCQSRVLRL